MSEVFWHEKAKEGTKEVVISRREYDLIEFYKQASKTIDMDIIEIDIGNHTLRFVGNIKERGKQP